MLVKEQKTIIHVYAHAAGLSDPAYRDILKAHAGVPSSADRQFSQSGYDQVMAALETVLFDRVHRHEVPNPIGRSRYIREEYYWRNRLPQEDRINSRQFRKIQEQWALLCQYLEPETRTTAYFCGIVYKATGRPDLGASALTHAQAGALIDALNDRLSYAIRNQPAEVPF